MLDGQGQRQQKRCLGTLFHSQARLSAEKEPICAGVKSKVHTAVDGLPKEVVPAGQFKYMCVGYSIYEKGHKSQSSNNLADTVELPYCEGLEVISASELLKTPATLNEAATVSGRDAMQQDTQRAAPARPRPGRSFVPGSDMNSDWDAFTERFLKTSKKIVDRMGSNLTFIGRSARQALDSWSNWRDKD